MKENMETHHIVGMTYVTVSRHLLIFWKAHRHVGSVVTHTRVGFTRHQAITAAARTYH